MPLVRYSRFGLPMLAAMLFLLLAVEWLLPDASESPILPPPAIPAAMTDTASDSAITQWANTVLARPLLTPDRRPERQVETEVTYTLPRLSAIIVIGGSRDAIFADSGQKPQLVAQGGQIGGYRLKTVAPDSVDLIGPDGPVTLRPQFASGVQASPSQ